MAEKELQAITIYFPRDFVATIDAQVEQRRTARPLSQTSRSDVVRELIEVGMRERDRKR